jgi:flavin-dependent dehydrogenase
MLEVNSPHDEFRIGRMARLYQRWLDEAVEAGAVWFPGRSYHEMAAPSAPGARFDVALERVGGAEREVLSTRFVVGADGVQSSIAADLKLSLNRRWIVGFEEVYRRAEPVGRSGSARLHCVLDPRLAPGYIAWAVDDGEEIHLGVGGHPRRFAPRDALSEFLPRAVELVSLEGAELVESRGGRIPVGGVLPRIARSQGLLVGDAAGAVSPLTAGGLDPCLRLSSFAAEVIERTLSGDGRAIGEYNGSEFRRRFRLRRWMRSCLSRLRWRWTAEAAVACLARCPNQSLARRIFFGRGSFPLEHREAIGAVKGEVEDAQAAHAPPAHQTAAEVLD